MPTFPPTKLIAAGTFERVPIASPNFCLVFHLSDLIIACSKLFRIKLLFQSGMKACVEDRALVESRFLTEECFEILRDASKATLKLS